MSGGGQPMYCFKGISAEVHEFLCSCHSSCQWAKLVLGRYIYTVRSWELCISVRHLTLSLTLVQPQQTMLLCIHSTPAWSLPVDWLVGYQMLLYTCMFMSITCIGGTNPCAPFGGSLASLALTYMYDTVMFTCSFPSRVGVVQLVASYVPMIQTASKCLGCTHPSTL